MNKDVTEAWKKYGERYKGHKDQYIGPVYISQKFNLPLPIAFDYFNFNPHNTGFDGYYLDASKGNFYFFISNMKATDEQIMTQLQQFIENGIPQIFGKADVSRNLVKKAKVEVFEGRSRIVNVFVKILYPGSVDDLEQSEVFNALREELEKKNLVINEMLRKNNISVGIIVGDDIIITPSEEHKYELRFEKGMRMEADGGEQMQMGFVRLMDMHKIHMEMKHRLFEKNIRFGLNEEKAPNIAIRSALKNILEEKVSPDYFTFHHNGITIFAEKAEFKGDKLVLGEPRVLNGAQTITTLSRFLEAHKKEASYKEKDQLLNRIKVIAKIITRCNEGFITQITISNNRQNPVEPWNLRANDMIQLKLADKMRKAGIFYERQENSFAHLSEEEMNELQIDQNKDIKIRKLALTFLAYQGELDKMNTIGKVFENDNYYEKTFREEYLRADVRRIVIGYKAQNRVRAVANEIESKGANKYYFVRYTRNLLWSLLLQGMYNVYDNEDLLEKYGTSMSIENAFTDMLKDVGGNKVRLVLGQMSEMEKYAQAIQESRFTAFRTHTAFKDAMDIARDMHGWNKIGVSKG